VFDRELPDRDDLVVVERLGIGVAIYATGHADVMRDDRIDEFLGGGEARRAG
jgi:hypothetical protein